MSNIVPVGTVAEFIEELKKLNPDAPLLCSYTWTKKGNKSTVYRGYLKALEKAIVPGDEHKGETLFIDARGKGVPAVIIDFSQEI